MLSGDLVGWGESPVVNAPWPGHDPFITGCTDYVVGEDIGELAPGHRFIVRGVCLNRERLWLYYAWKPGLTESMGGDVWFSVEYGADVLPETLDYEGSYDTSGGEFSTGEMCYFSRPPVAAQRAWFDFYGTTDNDNPACRVTIDLATKRVHVENGGSGAH